MFLSTLKMEKYGLNRKMVNFFNKVDTGDTQLAYSIHGEGEPLLLITGFAALMDYWGMPFINLLASRFKVIAFDNRGMGDSEKGSAPFSIEQFARDSADLLEALAIDRAHVMGWSMGSFITQELALNFPDKVMKLILYASNCGGSEAILPPAAVTKRLFDTTGTPEEMTQRALDLMFPPSWLRDKPGFAKAFTARPMTVYVDYMDTIREQVKAILSWSGTFTRLKGLQKKTLLLTGTEDAIVLPKNSDILFDLIPDATIVTIENGGHGMLYQFPEKLASAVIKFITS